MQVYEKAEKLFFDPNSSQTKYGYTYPGGTGMMQLRNRSDTNLYIRLLHLNGTFTKFSIPLVCDTDADCLKHAYPLNDGYTFAIQKSANKSAYGTLIDWSGQVLQR